jgi:hypothetical protein
VDRCGSMHARIYPIDHRLHYLFEYTRGGSTLSESYCMQALLNVIVHVDFIVFRYGTGEISGRESDVVVVDGIKIKVYVRRGSLSSIIQSGDVFTFCCRIRSHASLRPVRRVW